MAEGLHRMAGLELDAAAACFGAGVEHARAAGDPLATLTLRARRALVALLAGAVDEARAELAAIEPEAMAQRFWGEAGFAAAVLAVAATLAGDAEAPAVAERARRLYRRSGHAYTAAVVAPAVAALAARQHGLAEPLDAPPTGRGAPGGDEGLRTSSAVGVLCAVEANDATAARARLAAVSWRRGRAGPPTLANLPVLAALVEAGDLVGDRTAVLAARPALVEADRRGVAVVLGWPALVPRLLAVAARQAGDAGEARFQVERALRLTERRHLPAERAKVLVELARLEAEAQAPTQDRARGGPEVAGALLTEAAGIFDAGSLLGWVGRCEAVAHELGVTAAVLPSRVVDDRTILTDDVVGSTAANARLGDVLYLESLRVHDRIVRDRLRELGGDEIKHTGDGVNAIFRHAGDAARCALAIQADLAAWRRAEPDLALEVRCGLARGSLVPADGDYFGLVQSEAARLCALAAAGEVLVSQAVADVLADGRAGAGLTVEPRGRHRLKGLAGDVDVFRVSSDRT
jgi:class 3 adenylate cyclase